MKKEEKGQRRIHFFCDKCGFEVEQDAKNCPGCGRSFSSVKCPACGFVGQAALFGEGCPVCGYSASKGEKSQSIQTKTVQSAQTVSKSAFALARGGGGSVKREHTELPLWIYIITGVALLASLCALVLNLIELI